MTLSKKLRKVLLISASALMVASVGGGLSNLSTPSVSAKARTHRVAHHHYHKHHAHHHYRRHHMSKKARRRRAYRAKRRRQVAERRYRKAVRTAKQYKRLATLMYNDNYDNNVDEPWKTHKNLWSKGYLDAAQSKNFTPDKRPAINTHHIYDVNGRSHNYKLGWVAGFVNNNLKEGYAPNEHNKLISYMIAIKTYDKTAKYSATNEGAEKANGNKGYLPAVNATAKITHRWRTHYVKRHGHWHKVRTHKHTHISVR